MLDMEMQHKQQSSQPDQSTDNNPSGRQGGNRFEGQNFGGPSFGQVGFGGQDQQQLRQQEHERSWKSEDKPSRNRSRWGDVDQQQASGSSSTSRWNQEKFDSGPGPSWGGQEPSNESSLFSRSSDMRSAGGIPGISSGDYGMGRDNKEVRLCIRTVALKLLSTILLSL